MASRAGEVVCVTGGSGFIGSWIVHLLLRRGYTVHATVRNLGDEKETKHLEAMEGADSRLHLFQMDLLHHDSIAAAVGGAAGVIHVASPNVLHQVPDPQGEVLDPAIKGTISVLTAAKEVGVRRVVITSSICAMIVSPNNLPDAAKDEDCCWADEEYCRQNKLWYGLSKTNAEKAAWKFAEENGLDIVVVNPGVVLGPILAPALSASMQLTLDLLQGKEVGEEYILGLVHVKDVALAHILVYENTSAAGRHLCLASCYGLDDLAAKIEELYPEYKVQRSPKDTQHGLSKTSDASKKLIDLGMKFASPEQIIKDSVESFRSKGYLS